MRTLFVTLMMLSTTLLSAQGLVINEIVASNDSTSNIMDDFGEYDDWVELYNNTNQEIDLEGYYFSDDISEPDKWSFPAGISIPAEGYLVVWTDSDDEQGDLHTSFKLSKSGEQLILSDNSMAVLDSLTFGEQQTNVAFARIPNGTGDFTSRAPTFNANNEDGVFVRPLPLRQDFRAFPNPATSDLQIDFRNTTVEFLEEEATIQISDMTGKQVLNQNSVMISNQTVLNLDINHLNTGIHVLRIETSSFVFLRKIMIGK